jgi:hypothetical protein
MQLHDPYEVFIASMLDDNPAQVSVYLEALHATIMAAKAARDSHTYSTVKLQTGLDQRAIGMGKKLSGMLRSLRDGPLSKVNNNAQSNSTLFITPAPANTGLEPLFENVPGQWGTIWLFNGSVNNTINYATIKNATIGVLSEGNQAAANDKLTISNSQIFNASSFGILGRATSITAENVVINNCGQSSFAGTFGGKYNFTHCTIANYWNNSFRQFPALLLNDFIVDDTNTIFTNPLSEANFNNCIVYGNDNPEFLLENEGDVFNFKFTNCLLRFSSNNLFSR